MVLTTKQFRTKCMEDILLKFKSRWNINYSNNSAVLRAYLYTKNKILISTDGSLMTDIYNIPKDKYNAEKEKILIFHIDYTNVLSFFVYDSPFDIHHTVGDASFINGKLDISRSLGTSWEKFFIKYHDILLEILKSEDHELAESKLIESIKNEL